MNATADETGRLFHEGLESMTRADRAKAEDAFRRALFNYIRSLPRLTQTLACCWMARGGMTRRRCATAGRWS